MDSLPPSQQRTLTAVQGYLELGMWREALREMKSLPADLRAKPLVLELEVVVLIRGKRWKEAARVSRKLCKTQPDLPAGYIHLAYCLHEMGQTAAARETLLCGPSALEKEGTYFYNLACYDAVLGDIEAARKHLARSIRIDKRFRDFAKKDNDLAPLHTELQ